MKKLLFILFAPIVLLTSCSKSGVTPLSMEDVIVDKKWWDTTDEDGMLLTEEGDFYYLQLCRQDSLLGTWIIDGDLIKLRFYDNSIEYTALIGEVTSYTNTELKIKAQTNDTNLQANYIFTTEFIEIIGCTDSTAANYNLSANCDDNSCITIINGCTDSLALNYNPLANIDNGYCAYQGTHTYIPDDKFEQALINLGYDNILDNYILSANINTITILDVGGQVDNWNLGISDLTGIEDFASLTNLKCSNNPLTSLNLSNNTALTYLACGETSLTGLDLSSNTALTYLYCGMSPITNLNLSQNTALTHLSCQSTLLINLDLSNNTNLSSFYVQSNSYLSCIDVDDVAWSTANWTNIDGNHYFSENCP